MNKTKKKRLFRHLTHKDRDRIEALFDKGETQEEISKILKVDPSTISREMKRKRKTGIYDSDTAQHKASVKRGNSKYQGMKIENNSLLKAYIIRGLKEKRSPDEISGRMRIENTPFYSSKNAIYKWLYSAWGNKYAHLLCTQRRRKKKRKERVKREMIPNRIPLSMRPKKGIHGEGDLFVSPRRYETKESVAVIVENESKYISGRKMNNRKPETMVQAVRNIKGYIHFDDITFDNGIENKKHEEFGIQAYFCDPYSPWQKPLVEQSIGLIRRWFIPKKTDLRTVSEERLQRYIHILNNKWRRSLGYKSAYEVAMKNGILKTKIPADIQRQKVKQKVAFQG